MRTPASAARPSELPRCCVGTADSGCAALLIGHTNYQIRIGDLLSWNDDREVFWYPAEEENPETWKITPRKLWLVRILSRETYSV